MKLAGLLAGLLGGGGGSSFPIVPEPENPNGEITNLGPNCTQGLDKLLSQYVDSEALKDLICTLVSPLDALQQAYLDVNYNRWIDNAYGVQLDVIGNIIIEPRNGKSDTAYRLALKVRVLVNRSNGTTEELIAIALLQEPDLEDYLFRDYIPHAQVAWLAGPWNTGIDPRDLAHKLRQASAGGTSMHVVHTTPTITGTKTAALTFSNNVISKDANIGWGSSTETTGGTWSSVIGNPVN